MAAVDGGGRAGGRHSRIAGARSATSAAGGSGDGRPGEDWSMVRMVCPVVLEVVRDVDAIV